MYEHRHEKTNNNKTVIASMRFSPLMHVENKNSKDVDYMHIYIYIYIQVVTYQIFNLRV